MKIIKNVLSKNLYDKCMIDLKKKFNIRCWYSSSLFWEKNIKEQQPGMCAITPVSNQLQTLIKQEIKSHLPNYNELLLQYYVWHPHSGISIHHDKDYIFGGTIYLNEKWNPNSGGWFIWQDEKTSETGVYKSLLPTKNVMVLNDKHEPHLVTSVSSGCLENRYTIQIWGL
jgi:hypothetical protein